MARIPVYLSESSAALGQSPRASSQSFGGGQGLEAIGQAVSGSADVLRRYEEVKAERDATAYVSEQSAKLSLAAFNQLNAMKTDGEPIGTFAERFNEQYTKLSEQATQDAPNNIARNAMMQKSASIGLSLNLNANEYQANQVIAQHKQSSIDAANTYSNLIFQDPKNATTYIAEVRAIQESAKRYMTPQEVAVFKSKSDAEQATAWVRGVMVSDLDAAETLLTSEEITAVLPSNTFQSLSANIQSQRQQQQRKAVADIEAQSKLFTNDPALLVIQQGTNPDDMDGRIAAQKALGVRDGNVRLLANTEAAGYANTLGGITKADELMIELQKIEKRVGSQNYELAMRDIKRAGLPSDVAFVAMMDPQIDYPVMQAALAAAKDTKGDIKKVVSGRDISQAEISRAISDTMADTYDLLTFERNNGTQNVAEAQQNLLNIANYFIAQGQGLDDAVERATQWLIDSTPRAEMNNHYFRIPRNLTPDEVEDALSFALSNVSVPGMEIDTRSFRETAIPVLSADEKSYYFRELSGQYAVDKDLNTIQVDIAQAIIDRNVSIEKWKREEWEKFRRGE